MADFAKHIDALLAKEGGYVETNASNDKGGRTYAGVSYRSNPKWAGWALLDAGKIEEAKIQVGFVYKDNYWNPLRLDDVTSNDVAEVLFSASVLSGPRTALRLAQRVVGVPADGLIGPQTLSALNAADPEKFVLKYGYVRITRFYEIGRKNPSQRKWFRGWVKRILNELE